MGLALCILIYCSCGAWILIIDKRDMTLTHCVFVIYYWLPLLCALALLKVINPKTYYAIPTE